MVIGAAHRSALGMEPGQVVDCEVVEAELALVDHRERRGGHEGLGDGGETEDRVLARPFLRLAIGIARGAALDFLAVLPDLDDAADDGLAATAVSMTRSRRSCMDMGDS